MSWKQRVALYLAVFLGITGLSVSFILIAWAVPMGDFDTVHPVPFMGGTVEPLAAIKQVDSHTCGLLALSAIYRSYGLDPEERRLRQRLGVDTPAYIYDSSSTGCIHPDIYRVMNQDSFVIKSVPLRAIDTVPTLQKHLDSGVYALALIRRQLNGNLHWVVLEGLSRYQIRVHDSLAETVLVRSLDEYLKDRVISLLLVSTSESPEKKSVWRLHLAGAIDAWRAINVRPETTSP